MRKIEKIYVKTEGLKNAKVDNFSLGVLISKTKGDQIDLFAIDKDNYRIFNENLPEICKRILKQFMSEKKIHQIKWGYTSMPEYSSFNFDQTDGLATTLQMSNINVIEAFHCYYASIERYEEAISHPKGLEYALQKEYSIDFFPVSGVKYILHTPLYSQNTHIVKPRYSDTKRFSILFIDSIKLFTYWEKEYGPKKYQRFIDIFKKFTRNISENKAGSYLLQPPPPKYAKGYILEEMPIGFHIGQNGEINFENGWHRTMSAIRGGAPFIPMQIYAEHKNVIKQLFGWGN